MLVTGKGTHQQDVGLGFAVLGVVDAGGFLFQLLAQALGGSQAKALGKHHHSAHVQARGAAVAGHLLDAGVVGDFDLSLEHRVGEDGLGNLHMGDLLGQVAVGADDLARGFAGAGVVLLGPEGIGPTGAGTAQKHPSPEGEGEQAAEQG